MGEPKSSSELSAVVIGASITGLLAARALHESYRRVVVVDRDELPRKPAARRGVPQGDQLHVLLAGGAEVLDELFPGFTDELVAAGAVRGDPQRDATYYLDGRPIVRAVSGLTLIGASRPLVEHLIRQRVRQLPNVTVRAGVTVLDLEMCGAAVTGVRTSDPAEPVYPADLVVDAAGRGSRGRYWLQQRGVPPPASSRVRVDVVYLTREYRWEPDQLGGRQGVLVVPFPGTPRGAAVIRLEGRRWAVALFGLAGEEPSAADEATMAAFAKSLPVPDVAQLMSVAEPLTEPVLMRFPASVRRHLDQRSGHPAGYLVMGDALCSFNPTYGQGMTVSAMQARALRDLVAAGQDDLQARFYRAASTIVDRAWTLAVGGDLRFPEVDGARTVADRVLGAYLDRYRAATTVDPVLGRTFIRVANMLAPATSMVTPPQLLRVLLAGLRGAARRG